MTRVLMVRHGQSTWNAEHRWQGQLDPPLSPLGEAQARAGAEAVSRFGITHVFASDLQRARRTAELLAPDTQITPLVALRERTAGPWEGLTRGEIEEQFPGMLDERRWPPGFESDESLVARVRPALEGIAEQTGDDAVVLAVTHGGVIRSLIRLFEPTPDPLPNLGGRWFVISGGELDIAAPEVLIDPHDVRLTAPKEE
jgi:broad specificity phosphatase PhoE